MNKELTPLEAWKLIDKSGTIETLCIIETALKNYEELTSKPAILYGRTHGHSQALIDTICKNYKEVKIINLEDEKKLKALEIIKKRTTPLVIQKGQFYFLEYDNTFQYYITKEEYDLLKEVLL